MTALRLSKLLRFQHTAARRRLRGTSSAWIHVSLFQHTAARRRLADNQSNAASNHGFNTQPPEGGWQLLLYTAVRTIVSTHSRPKAAEPYCVDTIIRALFQHTAARRRLVFVGVLFASGYGFNTQPPEGGWTGRLKLGSENHVSTHSRPKAAARQTI